MGASIVVCVGMRSRGVSFRGIVGEIEQCTTDADPLVCLCTHNDDAFTSPNQRVSYNNQTLPSIPSHHHTNANLQRWPPPRPSNVPAIPNPSDRPTLPFPSTFSSKISSRLWRATTKLRQLAHRDDRLPCRALIHRLSMCRLMPC